MTDKDRICGTSMEDYIHPDEVQDFNGIKILLRHRTVSSSGGFRRCPPLNSPRSGRISSIA